MTGDRGIAPGGDHQTFDELAVGWALHALEPEDEAAFAVHLRSCERCARTVTETVDVMAAMAADLPVAEPSADLHARLRAAVEETEQTIVPAAPAQRVERRSAAARETPAGGRPAERPGSADLPRDEAPAQVHRPPLSAWRRRLPAALVAAAVAAIVGLGIWNISLNTSREEMQATVAEQAEIMEALLRPGQATVAPLATDDGDPVATVVAREGEVHVVTDGLSLNDRDASTYVVWGLPEGDDEPVPLGTFDVLRAEMDLRTVGSDRTGLDDYSTYAVSLERGREAPEQPTQIVAKGQVAS